MIVIIDNYDSFTYNLVQYYQQLDSDVRVYRNDATSVDFLENLKPSLVVLSPGPGKPSDSGICRDILTKLHQQIPVFGVCLGFQLICEFFGGKVIKGQQPMHGKVTEVEHDQCGVFDGIASPTKVTRYHSLVAQSSSLPSELIVSSRAVDGAIMGVRHSYYPVEAIQFHPESILTEQGFEMIKNSYEQAIAWERKRDVTNNEALSTIRV